ncbi:MAG: Asp-tRNA(Asn)/Glu-tRNA(Gln) amidotransferase subunit GatB [Anaerolineales bacterium]
MYEPVIGLEVHIEMQTRSKMFCACPVVDSVSAEANSAVCSICAGHPGTLPVVNARAVEFALRVALALNCQVNPVSIFARKNYFYPDIPKGYQITQYEQPLAERGQIVLQTSQGEKTIRIRRAHLEEDTGKLAHISAEPARSLVDLNRAGVPLLEIVTEPDFHSAEEVRLYAESLRRLVRYLGVNSGDLEKGVMRIEPNISLRPRGSESLGTKVEIKNLNSFRALERGVAYEIARQSAMLASGRVIAQETVGWDEARQMTYSQRSKEDAHDYRYFPEPDLPPLVVDPAWLEQIRAALPELPWQRAQRLQRQYGLSAAESARLVEEKALGEYFEQAAQAGLSPRTVFAWVTGELTSLMNAAGAESDFSRVSPKELAALIELAAAGNINQATAKTVLAEMFTSGRGAAEIVAARGLGQVSDEALIARLVAETLAENAAEVASFRAGKENVFNFLFGQVMRKAGGKANPQALRAILRAALQA